MKKHNFITIVSAFLTISIMLPTEASAVYKSSMATTGLESDCVVCKSSALHATAFSVTATPTVANVLVNGKEMHCDAYNINRNNYFKLRDLATALSGTQKEFDVTWDSNNHGISMTSNHTYTPVGGELAEGDYATKQAKAYTAAVYLDGTPISLTAYTINGNNYFKLRDIGKLFNFMVAWNNAVIIDTSQCYTEEATASEEDYEIKWTDRVIERAARAILKKKTGNIKRSELDSITNLKFYYSSAVYNNDIEYAETGLEKNVPIKSTADFKHFSNLESLCFLYNDGIDFSNMPALKKLTSLEVNICSNITGLSGLARLSNLNSLDLYGTESAKPVTFNFLACLLNLKDLDIARTGITDLTPLENLSNLEVLKIYGNQCDAAAISKLAGLKEIIVSTEVKNRELLRFVPAYTEFNAS